MPHDLSPFFATTGEPGRCEVFLIVPMHLILIGPGGTAGLPLNNEVIIVEGFDTYVRKRLPGG